VAHPQRVEADPRPGTASDTGRAAGSTEQAADLRRQAWAKPDLPHPIDAVEAAARAERNAVTSALRISLFQMLKRDHQPDLRTRNGAPSIRVQRLAVRERVEDSPNLASRRESLRERASRRARIEAAAETNLAEATFPEASPYGIDAVLNREVSWPPAAVEKARDPSKA
jgi:hypothetical protein